MKKLILFICLFLFLSISTFGNAKDFDFKDYYLTGIFKKEIYREDYFHTWEFIIFNNKIYINYEGDMAGGGGEKFPNGEYELTTYNSSKIKIEVDNGEIKDFVLLSSIKEFKQKEKKYTENDYCDIALFYANFDYAYGIKENHYYTTYAYNYEDKYRNNKITRGYSALGFHKYKDKVIVTGFDYHGNYSSKNELLKLIAKNAEEDKNAVLDYTVTQNSKIFFEIEDKNPDVIIKNCIAEFYNDFVLPL